MQKNLILAINPGSTSTKIAVYNGEQRKFEKKIAHSASVLAQFDGIIDQFDFRKQEVLRVLSEENIHLEDLNVIIARGGMLKPLDSGVYAINQTMIDDIYLHPGLHVSSLAILIANDFKQQAPHIIAIMSDPPCVDEMHALARISGLPELPRTSIFHALNQKAVARLYAEEKGEAYEDMTLIVAHLGGGISVGIHVKGKVVDVNNALDGDGPFSPERSGTLPVGGLVELCFSGQYTQDEVLKKVVGGGGMVALLGTNDMKEIAMRCDTGDPLAIEMTQAMAYQVAKEIAALSAVVHGKIDAIILTGGIAYDKRIVSLIEERICFIAPVVTYPGEDEMHTMMLNAMRVLTQSVEVLTYE